MPRADESKYTDKQERKVDDLAEGLCEARRLRQGSRAARVGTVRAPCPSVISRRSGVGGSLASFTFASPESPRANKASSSRNQTPP